MLEHIREYDRATDRNEQKDYEITAQPRCSECDWFESHNKHDLLHSCLLLLHDRFHKSGHWIQGRHADEKTHRGTRSLVEKIRRVPVFEREARVKFS